MRRAAGRTWWLALALLCLGGVGLRVAFVGAPGFPTDVAGYAFWAERMSSVGPSGFYAPGLFVDYPPGFLLVLWPLGAALDGESLRIAIKAISIPADVAIALLAARWVRDQGRPGRGLVVAALWLLAPTAIFAGAYWGQVDALGSAAVLGATLAAGVGRWTRAGALAGVAALLKLQFAVGGWVLLAAALVEALRGRTLRPLAGFVVPAVAIVLLVGLPFRMGPAQLVELARRASETYPYTSLFAFNPWSVVAGFWVKDAPYFPFGAALLSAGLVASIAPLWWRRDTRTLLACAAFAALSFYFLPTRAHERYLLPALALLLPLLAMLPALALPYTALLGGALLSFYAAFIPRGLIGVPADIARLAVDRPAQIALSILMTASAAAAVPLALRRPRDLAAAAHRLIRRSRSQTRSGSRSHAGQSELSFEWSPERRLLVILVAAKLVGLVLVLSPGGLSAFDLPKSGWSRAAAWLMAGVLAFALTRYGTSIVPRSRVLAAIAALVGATALSALFAEHQYTALFGERTRYLGLTFTLDMALLAVAVAVAFRTRRAWAGLALALAAAAAVAMIYGASQVGTVPRAYSTFGNPDMFGHFLAVTASVAAAVARHGGGRRLRAAAAGLALVSVGLVVLVATRGALLGLGGGVLAIGVCELALRGRRAARSLALAALGAGALTAAIFALTPLGGRMAGLLGGSELADRLIIWDGSWRAFLLRPFLGVGPDNLGATFHYVRLAGTEAAHQGAVAVDQAHNVVLQQLVTTGVLGAAALVAIIVFGAAALWRAVRWEPLLASALLAGAAAYWAHGLVSVDALSVSWIPWVVAGGAATLGPLPAAGTTPRRIPRPATLAVTTAVLLVALSGSAAVRANEAAGRASDAYRRGSAAETTDAVNEAITLDPGRGEHWNYRGLARLQRGLSSLAAEDFAEAARRVPHQTNYLANLARARLAQALEGDMSAGGAAAAYDAARRAVAIEPNLASTHRVLAEVALAFGDPDLALGEAVTAIVLDPRDGRSDAIAVAAAQRHAVPDRARELLGRAIAVRRSSALEGALAALLP